jgi:hypothetical protein
LELASDIGLVQISIPAWQMGLYVALVGFFMLGKKSKWCLLTTYVFALYWGYYSFGPDLFAAARGDALVETAYIGFGLLLVAFVLISFFYEEN